MNGILSVFKEHRIEKIIERSRFIATCVHAESEEDSRAFIARIRSEFSDATHNCFAFVADQTGNLLRFSDDGEPQGTAGVPILEAIRGRKLFQTAVVVTRYFGGVKLGAGGLVRAYAGAAGECLDGAEKRSFELCARFAVTVGYELVDSVKRFLNGYDCTLSDIEYADKVRLTVAVRASGAESFERKLTDFALGRVALEKAGEFIYPFEI